MTGSSSEAVAETSVIVTGGSRGIGLATVRAFLESGSRVTCVSRSSSEPLEQLAARYGARLRLERLDVAQVRGIERLVDRAIAAFGHVDVLVNNAGIADPHVIYEVTEPDFDRLLDVNVKATYFFCKYVLRSMLPRRHGRIVNVGSIMGIRGYSGGTLYGASKAAVVGLTRALAREVGGKGVTVNALLPGFIETDMTSGFTADHREAIVRRTPCGRLGRPSDVVAAILFIASEGAAYMTGQSLVVDGGLTC